MKDDTVRRLAQADPAAELDPSIDEDLLARTLDRPRVRADRPRARLRLAACAAILVLAGVIAPALRSDERGAAPTVRELGNLELAARAYRLTAPRSGEILHTVVTYVSQRVDASGRATIESRGREEQWHRGTDSHTLLRYGGPSIPGGRDALDHLVASGVMRQISLRGEYRIVRAADNGDSARAIREEQRGFVEQFRRDYEQGNLDPAGDVTFAGRPARRYVHETVIDARDQAGKMLPSSPGPTQTYYIDRETGEPLGRTSDDGPGQLMTPNGRSFDLRSRQTVELIEWLPPTAEHLASLRNFTLVRRRDAHGCIRGAQRKRADGPKRDCGGTPGAPIGGDR